MVGCGSGQFFHPIVTVGAQDACGVGIVEVGDTAEGCGGADFDPCCRLESGGVADGVGGVRGGRPGDEVDIGVPDEVLDFEGVVG